MKTIPADNARLCALLFFIAPLMWSGDLIGDDTVSSTDGIDPALRIRLEQAAGDQGAEPLGGRAIRWLFGRLADTSSMAAPHEKIYRGKDLSVAVPRARTRPGGRWLELLVQAHPREEIVGGRPEYVVFMATVFDAEASEPVAVARRRGAPDPGWARFDSGGRPKLDNEPGKTLLELDLRSLEIERAWVLIEMFASLSRGGELLCSEVIELATGPAVRPWLPEEKVAVTLEVPTGVSRGAPVPITFGFPVPAGALWDAGKVRLVDAGGVEIPSQRAATGRWERGGAIRWLRFDALVPPDETVFVEPASAGEQAVPSPALRLEDAGDGCLVLDTGAARFYLGPGPSPIHRVYRSGRRMATAGPRGLYVVDQQGRVASATTAGTEMRVEARGPVAASVRFEGFYETDAGERIARHITRIEGYAGQPEVAVTHTLILIRDTNEVWLQEAGWEFEVETGETPRALFAVDREQWEAYKEVPLEGTARYAYLVQEDYVQFRGGRKRYVLGTEDSGGETAILAEGEVMGDWAALLGEAGGLSLACRESARQFPKEFLAGEGRIVLKLFSHRAGHTLDFRPAALAARWDRGGMLVEGRHRRIVDRGESLVPAVRATPANAQGWSKTHQLTFTPLEAGSGPEDAIRASRRNSVPVYALSDPWWLYESRVFGALYPRDRERFPEAETFIDKAFEPYFARGHERDQEYGFVDYYAGPHYRSMGTYRYHTTYNIRPASWILYARSGERPFREWAAGTLRTYMDGQISHWGLPEDPEADVVRGLFNSPPGIIGSMAPYYWGGNSLTGALGSLIKYYHLTGYRRAGDVIRQYADGLKYWWRPRTRIYYPRGLIQAAGMLYRETWDRDIRVIYEDSFNRYYDPDSEVGVAFQEGARFGVPERDDHRDVQVQIRNHALYKSPGGLGGMIAGWEDTGDRRFHHIARGWAWANYYGHAYPDARMGLDPLRGRFEKGRTGYFLYQETGQQHLAEEMLLAVKRSMPGESATISAINWDIQAIAYGLALVAETGVDRRSVASWLAYDDSLADGKVRIFARKAEGERLIMRTLRIKGVRPLAESHLLPGRVHDGALHPREHKITRNPAARIGRLHIREADPSGAYELVSFGDRGYNFVFSDSRHPLVLHAAGEWQPAPLRAVRWPHIYFEVPEQRADSRIHFVGSARVTGPDGVALNNGAALSGWVTIPRPGMWSFEPVVNKPVRVEHIPPFFAFRDPDYHFIPDEF